MSASASAAVVSPTDLKGRVAESFIDATVRAFVLKTIEEIDTVYFPLLSWQFDAYEKGNVAHREALLSLIEFIKRQHLTRFVGREGVAKAPVSEVNRIKPFFFPLSQHLKQVKHVLNQPEKELLARRNDELKACEDRRNALLFNEAKAFDKSTTFATFLRNAAKLPYMQGETPTVWLCASDGDEGWVGDFFEILEAHLRALGVAFPEGGARVGDSEVERLERAAASDYLLVAGTPILLQKHQEGTDAICGALNRVMHKREQDLFEGRFRVLPMVLGGVGMRAALPAEYERYVMARDWRDQSYLTSLIELIVKLKGLPRTPYEAFLRDEWRETADVDESEFARQRGEEEKSLREIRIRVAGELDRLHEPEKFMAEKRSLDEICEERQGNLTIFREAMRPSIDAALAQIAAESQRLKSDLVQLERNSDMRRIIEDTVKMCEQAALCTELRQSSSKVEMAALHGFFSPIRVFFRQVKGQIDQPDREKTDRCNAESIRIDQDKGKLIYDEQRAYDEADAFKIFLAKLKEHPLLQTFSTVFICHAWPEDHLYEEEAWVDDFLITLKRHLFTVGGAEIDLDKEDSQIGGNITTGFMSHAETRDFVLVAGTKSLLLKHTKGTSNICVELSRIQRKRESDIKRGLHRMLPLILGGDKERSLPAEYATVVPANPGEQGYLAAFIDVLISLKGLQIGDREIFEGIWKESCAEKPFNDAVFKTRRTAIKAREAKNQQTLREGLRRGR